MAELKEIPITAEYVPGSMNHLLKLEGHDHKALAVYFPSKNGWDVTCSCDDPTVKGGKSRWWVNGESDIPVTQKFQAHLSYYSRPKTRAD